MPREPYVDGAMVRDAGGRWMNHGHKGARVSTLTRDVSISGATRAGERPPPPGRAMDAADLSVAHAVCAAVCRAK